MKHCLTIAGSDCIGGAGIQADIKTFSALGCYAMSVITAVVAENTTDVISSTIMPPESIMQQIDAVFKDVRVDGVKVGMLPDKASVNAAVLGLKKYKPPFIVCDPVMVATCGGNLMENSALSDFIENMLPICDILTPNLQEAEVLSQMSIKTIDDMKTAARKIHNMGAESVLVKGGHLDSDAIDILFDGKNYYEYSHKRINTKNTHGTGCTLSSAITAFMSKGDNVSAAVENAKKYISGAIENGLDIGHGNGPVWHFYNVFGKEQ